MTSVIDLKPSEVRILLSGLHNLSIDKGLLDYLTSVDSNAKDKIEKLICKFEDSFKEGV